MSFSTEFDERLGTPHGKIRSVHIPTAEEISKTLANFEQQAVGTLSGKGQEVSLIGSGSFQSNDLLNGDILD